MVSARCERTGCARRVFSSRWSGCRCRLAVCAIDRAESSRPYSPSASNAARCSHAVRVIPCRLAAAFTLASSMASNLRLTTTLVATATASVTTGLLDSAIKAAAFRSEFADFTTWGRRTKLDRDDLAWTTTRNARSTPSRARRATIAAADKRFIVVLGGERWTAKGGKQPED